MTEQSEFEESHVTRDAHADEASDYAAEYRSNIRTLPGNLKGTARFGVNHAGLMQEVEIPLELQSHRYIGPMVAAINSPDSGITTSRVWKYKRTFELILKVGARGVEPDWRYFGRSLLKCLKSESISEHGINENMENAKRLFKKAAEASDDVKVKREIRAIVGGRGAKGPKSGYWPKLTAVKSKPTRSLEDIFGNNLKYTNEQYIDLLIDYASAFIRAWSDIRRRLRDNHPELHDKIYKAVTRIGADNIKKIEKKRTHSPRIRGCRDEWFELASLNIEILVALDDPFLNMIAMSQWRNTAHFERFAAEVDLAVNGAAGFADQLLNRRVAFSRTQCSIGNARSQWAIWKDGKKVVSLSARLMLSLLDFFGPSPEEEACFIWLLATRRIQLSNVGRLKRTQVNEDATGIWIRTYKARNGKAENICIKKNTKFGRALQAYLRDYDQNPFRNAGSDAVTSSFLSPVTSYFHSNWNFHHLALPHHKEGLSVYGLSDANLTAMKEIYAVVIKAQHRNKEVSESRDGERLRAKGLLPSAIAQSHVYAEEAKRGGFTKSPTMLPTYDRENPDENSRKAQNQFHTLETREEVYRARSRDKLKLKKGRAFAAAVSEEMANISDDIISAWEERTSPLPVSVLVDVVGLRGNAPEAPPETILAAAKAEKFLVEKSGLIRKDGMIYLFDSGLTARMMMEEIRHIEEELERLFSTQDLDKALNAWSKLCFLELLMKRFSPVSLKDATEKYGHLEGKIPHAPISEGGNSWIVK